MPGRVNVASSGFGGLAGVYKLSTVDCMKLFIRPGLLEYKILVVTAIKRGIRKFLTNCSSLPTNLV